MDENMTITGGKLLGHEVVKLIREMDCLKSCVIIGYSGCGGEVRDKLFAAGCDEVWVKPMINDDKEYAKLQILKMFFDKSSNSNTKKQRDRWASDI